MIGSTLIGFAAALVVVGGIAVRAALAEREALRAPPLQPPQIRDQRDEAQEA